MSVRVKTVAVSGRNSHLEFRGELQKILDDVIDKQFISLVMLVRGNLYRLEANSGVVGLA